MALKLIYSLIRKILIFQLRSNPASPFTNINETKAERVKDFSNLIQFDDNIIVYELQNEVDRSTINNDAHTSKRTHEDTPNISCEPPTKKTFFPNNEINLRDVLESNVIGRAILTIYEFKKELSTQCQSYLCDIIVTHYFQRNI